MRAWARLISVNLSLFKQKHYMIRNFILTIVTLSACVSCVTDGPYQPASCPEKREFAHDRLDVYPDDIRKNPALLGTPVVWAGIIRSTDARELDYKSEVGATTVFEHHYFDWVQDSKSGRLQLSVSPRGEGLFRSKWVMKKTENDATAEMAEKFAKPGKLAIFYGTPESIDPDGMIILKYRYIRIVGMKDFNTNEFDYGRLGEPFHEIHPSQTNATALQPH
jgi:hypothetical protein